MILQRRRQGHWTAAALPLLLLLLLLQVHRQDAFLLQDTPVSYVMEPFESIGDDWFTDSVNSDAGAFHYSITNNSDDFLFGESALRIEHSLDATTTTSNNNNGNNNNDTILSSFDFGWIHPTRSHNCHGASEISIWYKMDFQQAYYEASSSNPAPPLLRVTLLDDSFCMNNPSFDDPILPKHVFCAVFADEVVLFEESLQQGTTETEDGSFQELRLDLSELPRSLDLTRIRGWKIHIEGTDPGDVLFLDQFACHGGGSLLGAAMHTGGRSLEQSVEDGSWIETYYNSELARNASNAMFGNNRGFDSDGTLTIDYLVQQVESWGGFNDYAHLAPGPAYYNISEATELAIDYDVLQVSSSPGRAIFRLLLQDNSDCIGDECESNYHKHERWYSFHGILDEAGPGTLAIPLIGSLEPTTPFWLTGWSGIVGDSTLSLEELKGFSLEIVLDSVLPVGGVVTGAVAFSNMAAAVASDLIDTGVSYVIEPFESIAVEWEMDLAANVNMTFATGNDALFGNSSLQLMSEAATEDDTDNNSTTEPSFVRWVLRDRPHNCHGADHISFWYKSLQPDAKLRMVLFDDTECLVGGPDRDAFLACNRAENLKPFVLFEGDDLVGDGEWHEVQIPTTRGILEDLNLARIRGWMVEWIAGTTTTGTIFVDQLACVGGGDMFGSAFHIDPGQTFTDARNELSWLDSYYNSAISANQSSSSLQDGTLGIDYTVQQVESWGGFLDFAHLAPGHAYYNLSQATDLLMKYNVRDVGSVPGRAIFRFVLQENRDCESGCDTGYHNHERWYSFHSILDEAGPGQIVIPLVGSPEPSTPFWLTGWSGIIGNRELDLAEIKGFTIEIVLDSVLPLGSLVTGGVDFFDFAAVYTEPEDETIAEGDVKCVTEEDLHFFPNFGGFTRIEFLAAQCCEICESDPDCNYALIGGRDCFTAPYIDPNFVGLLDNEILQSDRSSFWVDSAEKRGDFCEKCECFPDLGLIDCKGQDLLIVPKTFQESWSPRILDLRDNDKLSIIGSGSLDEIADSLEEIRVPISMKHLSPGTFVNLPVLSSIQFQGAQYLTNSIVNPTDFFGDVCCGIGSSVELNEDQSLSFCDLEVSVPGVDAVYEPFINYVDATPIQIIKPSSSFMSEAAESVEKCAEFCAINDECFYFGYDARLPNAEHACALLADAGSRPDRVCCTKDNYADEVRTIPGWISGYPPRTRHIVDNAKVLYSASSLVANSGNGFQASYDVSLGAMPLRGAVWVQTAMVTDAAGLEVTVQPSRFVLYNQNQTTTVTITVRDVTSESPPTTLILNNMIDACDEAFTVSEDSDEDLVYVVVEIPEAEEDLRWGLAIGLPLGLLLLTGLGVFLFYENKRKENDAVWHVNKDELKFSEPPEIVGRGTFGLVLMAEYRGTQVAVKRVLPPRTKKKGSKNNSNNNSRSNHTGTISGTNETSSRGGDESSSNNQGFISGSYNPGLQSDSNNPGLISGSNRTKAGMESGSKIGIMSGSGDGDERNYKKPNSKKRGFARTSAIGYSSNSNVGAMLSNVFSLGKLLSPRASTSTWKRLRQEFIEEMRYMSKLRHPCVTTVMGAVIVKHEDPMLVMEYMEHGSLYDILHNETMPIDGELLLPILRDIAQGMRFLHAASPQVLHGDLKAANILVDGKFRGKVADFGLSQKKNLGGTGTPFWMAPELLRRESTNTAASDVYSFGIILYEVYSRKDPYDGEDAMEVLSLVADKEISKRPPVPENCPAQVHSLLADCIVDDAATRPTFEEIDTRLKRIDTALLETHAAQKNTAISLFDIFPKHIAEALRDGKTVEPEHREVATIFFSDIVGFTSISSELPPMKVASMLDRLYTKLDALSQKHDIFKVETIGDAYMAVTNLVKDQPDDHCKRIAQFAIEALAAANGTLIDLDDHDKGYVNIRVGFHSGSIVADVVGTRNPRYCLFGDAVNTASRMESTSKANRIHCSNKAADILLSQCPDIPLKSRGIVHIKGKGDMQTYWVNYEPSTRRGNKKKPPGGMKTVREAENSGEFGPETRDGTSKSFSFVDISDKGVDSARIVSDRTAETVLSDATPLDLEAQMVRLMREQDNNLPPESAPMSGNSSVADKSSVADRSIMSLDSEAPMTPRLPREDDAPPPESAPTTGLADKSSGAKKMKSVLSAGDLLAIRNA